MEKSNVFKKLDKIQEDAVKAIFSSLKKTNKALVVMATGIGKTETAIKAIKAKGGRHLWIVGRNALVEQTYERFIEAGLHDVGMLNGYSKDVDSEIIIASMQTLSKKNILKLLKSGDFDTIWIDEAHHAAAPAENEKIHSAYQVIINHFKSRPLVGLTATPDRPDTLNIYDHFGTVTFEKKFEDAQDIGVLAPHEPMTILTNSVLEGFSTKDGDYSAASLERLYTSVNRNQTIVKSYKKYAKDVVLNNSNMKPKAICFCINVEHAKRLTAEFNKKGNGVKAEFICANARHQNQQTRFEIEEKFRTTNEIEVLCAVDLLNEGVDIPDVNIVLMARPTRSAIVYQQQLGRAARINEGKKKFFVVLDFVDNCRQEYGSYSLGNILKRNAKNIPVNTEFLTNKDPIVVQERVENYREGVNNFIKSAREAYDLTQMSISRFKSYLAKKKLLPKGGL